VGTTALADAGSRFRQEQMRGDPENSGSGNRALEEAPSRDGGRDKGLHGVPSLEWMLAGRTMDAFL
jgi:hypothetical protein